MIVIADDITGAAEMAGIAFAQGHPVRLLCATPASVCSPFVAPASVCSPFVAPTCVSPVGCDSPSRVCPVGCDSVATQATTVIATDTRSMTEAEATAETRRILLLLSSEGNSGTLLFKKTDSALRGHVVAELSALMEATGYSRAVYLPANPSKGRIIRNGTYLINNTPIHQTDFSFDPEFPATTSVLRERFPNAEAHGIIMPDAETETDILQIITKYNDGHTLFAGAADLFTALNHGDSSRSSDSALFDSTSTLILCGSTQSRPLDIGIPVAPMPQTLYDGATDLSLWDTSAYNEQHRLILTIPHHHRTGKDAAVHLRTITARKAKELIALHRPNHLVIEGGATAWVTLQILGWNDFEITRQIAPGVVEMRAACGTLVTLKPGSYPWQPVNIT